MRRREFILLLGGAAVGWPLVGFSQQPDQMKQIGMLGIFAANDPGVPPRIAAFQQGLRELGWVEGRNVQIDYRWTGGDPEQMRSYAAELVALKPDVIVVIANTTTIALLRETRTIPIVFIAVSDPVGSGIIDSLARPGGNITGFMNFHPDMATKWLELLKMIAPRITRVVSIFNPKTTPLGGLIYLHPIEAAAPSFAVEPIAAPLQDTAEIEPAIMACGRQSDCGLIVLPDIFTTVHRERIISLTFRDRVPAIYPFNYFAREGGLMSYGVDVFDLYFKSATYVDRVLRGAKPGDLPVQMPTKIELVVNLKTAKALGITFPPSIMVRADEVIE
jgi:putative ABC transport system substrate-binding protein